MAQPATLRVNVISDTRRAREDLDKFSSKINGVVAGATAAVTSFAIDKTFQGITAAAGFISDGIQAAGNLNAALETLRYNYGAGAAAIEQWAKRASDGLGISERAAVTAANRFAVYTKAIGLAGQDAADFSTGMVKLASDLGAFSDLPVEDAINAIGSAFRGERDPLEKFGVLLNDANVKAAYFRRTGEEVNGTLTTQQNILGTLQVLQEKGIEIGDAWARESDQLGASQQTLNARLEDVRTTIGQALLPTFQRLIGGLGDVVKAYQDGGIAGVWEELKERWDTSLEAIRVALGKWLTDNLPDFSEWTRKASNWISDASQDIGPKLDEFFRELKIQINEREYSLGEAGGLIASAIAKGLIGSFRDRLRETAETIKTEGVYFFYNALLDAISPFGPFRQLIIQQGRDFVATFLTGIIDGWNTVTRWLAEAIRNLVDTLLDPLSAIGSKIRDAIPFGTSSSPNNAPSALAPAGYTFAPTIYATIPPGVNGQDVGAAIVASLEDYVARNGPLVGLTA